MNGAGLGSILQGCGRVVGVKEDQFNGQSPIIPNPQGQGEVAYGITRGDTLGGGEVRWDLRALGLRAGRLLVWGQGRQLGVPFLAGANG
jgi:hypothetical protein